MGVCYDFLTPAQSSLLLANTLGWLDPVAAPRVASAEMQNRLPTATLLGTCLDFGTLADLLHSHLLILLPSVSDE